MVDQFVGQHEGLAAVAINLDMEKDAAGAKAFAEKQNIAMPMLFAETENPEYPLDDLQQLPLRAVPTNFFLDTDGVIVGVQVGAVDEEMLTKFEEAQKP